MSRIDLTFQRLKAENRKGLIPFITSGDPSPDLTVPLMHALVTGGADIIELGVPFSDPMADGPTIQRASERALAKGVSLKAVLGMVKEFRKTNAETPVVLMGYANPIEYMGPDVFIAAALEAGVDGVLVVDSPPEECRDFAQSLRAHGIDPLFLIAPTSTEQRFRSVAEAGSGYVYYVSLKGVTGAAHLDLDEVAKRIPIIRDTVKMPVGVGFGIRDAESARNIGRVADAIIIGSRIIEEIENGPPDEILARVENFMRNIREALDEIEISGQEVPV